MAAISSKEAQAHLIDPMNAPEPAMETGLNTHFGNTMAPKPNIGTEPSSHRSSLSFNNPFRDDSGSPSGVARSPSTKKGPTTTTRPISREGFPNHRDQAFAGYSSGPSRSASGAARHGSPSYNDATNTSSAAEGPSRRRGSSLKERYPGDDSHKPLDVIRRDSRKARRSPHLDKRHIPGADIIDRLDPAIGGRAYHHEGPYDAATLARNTDPKDSPIAALETTNREALKATPAENIKDAVERHQPLDGVAIVPPGEQDRFGRTYQYEEGADLMREPNGLDAGYKRWPGKNYDPEDLKGQSEPGFSLDRALRAHKIDDDGIEMEDRAAINKDYHRAEREGTLDTRDPVDIAGDDRKYVDMEFANTTSKDAEYAGNSSSLKSSLKRRIGSLRHKNKD